MLHSNLPCDLLTISNENGDITETMQKRKEKELENVKKADSKTVAEHWGS